VYSVYLVKFANSIQTLVKYSRYASSVDFNGLAYYRIKNNVINLKISIKKDEHAL